MPIQISIGNDEVILPNNLSSIPTIGNADTSVPVLPPNITPLSGLSLTALSDENIVVTGSPIVNGGTLTFALAEMNVVPGTYTSPVLTIDAYGRIAAAESFAATPGQGTVIEIAAIGDKNITVIGDSVTASGTFSFALTTTGVTAGTYGKVTVDEYGRVTAGIDLAAADINIALGPYAVANANEAGKLAAAQTIAIAGDAFGETTFDGSAGATIVVTLAATGVTAGTYTNAAFVVDETGRVTNADSDVAGSDGTFSAFISTDENITVAPPFITNNATIAIGLATNGVSVGTYTLPEIVVDAMGRVTSAISLDINSFVISIGDDTQEVVHVYASGNSFGQAQFRGMVGNGNISVGLTTDDSSLTFSLTPTTVTAGTYSNANIVVDAYGRLTSAVNGTSGSGISGSPSNELISVDAIGDSNIFVNGGPITTEGTLTIGLGTTGVIAGSYTNFVVDSYGRLIAARGLVASDVTTALGTYAVSAAASAVSSEQLATAQTIAIAGDIAGSTTFDGSTSVTITAALVPTGVVAGTYTNANIAVSADGRVLSASSAVAAIGDGGTFRAAFATDGNISVFPDAITNNSIITIGLVANGVSVGTYTNANVVVDAYGRLTSVSNGTSSGTAPALTASDVTAALGTVAVPAAISATTADQLASAQTIAISGDVNGSTIFDGSANVTITATLAATGVVAGTYGSGSAVPVISTDANGRITAVRTVAIVAATSSGTTSSSSQNVNEYVFTGTSTGSTVILTTDGSGTPNGTNIGNIPVDTAAIFTLTIIARSVTGSTQNIFTWSAIAPNSGKLDNCLVFCGNDPTTLAFGETSLDGNPLPPQIVSGPQSNSSATAPLPTLGLDTTNGGFAITWTPPTSDTWSIVGYMKTITVQ